MIIHTNIIINQNGLFKLIMNLILREELITQATDSKGSDEPAYSHTLVLGRASTFTRVNRSFS